MEACGEDGRESCKTEEGATDALRSSLQPLAAGIPVMEARSASVAAPAIGEAVGAPSQTAPDSRRQLAAVLSQVLTEVEHLSISVSSMRDVVDRCGQHLEKTERSRRQEATPERESLMRVHDIVFAHMQSLGKGSAGTRELLLNILRCVESELQNLGVVKAEPEEGFPVDYSYMEVIGFKDKPLVSFKRKKTVARVESCAFCTDDAHGDKMLRRAKVLLWGNAEEPE